MRKLDERYRVSGAAFRVRRRMGISGPADKPNRLNVNFAYQPYTGSILGQLRAAGHKAVDVEFDRRDIRNLDVLAPDGRILGRVKLQGRWQSFPHDARLRCACFRNARDTAFLSGDPIAEIWKVILNRTPTTREALQIFDLYRRICAEQPEAVACGSVVDVVSDDATMKWKPVIAEAEFAE